MVDLGTPALPPVAFVALCLGAPMALVLGGALYTKQRYGVRFRDALAEFTLKRSLVVLVLSLALSVLLLFLEAQAIFGSLAFGGDINYYLRVNSAEYDAMSLINSAISQSALSTVSLGRRRKLSSSSTFILAYHLDAWENVLTSEAMHAICLTESQIQSGVQFLDFSDFSTVVPFMFDLNCLGYDASSIGELDSDQIAAYFQDNFNQNNPSSGVLLSYAKCGSCEDLSVDQVLSQLNQFAVNSIQVSFIEKELLTEEFSDAIWNAVYLTVVALVVFSIAFVVWVRGIVCALATLFALVVSLTTAASLLPLWGYGSFSAFNSLSVFLLIGIGANSVLLFSSSWNSKFKLDRLISHRDLISIYYTLGEAFLFTVMAACLSLFSKLASPVIVISQLGAFMGIAVIAFYILFHTVIIPTWILCSRYHFYDKLGLNDLNCFNLCLGLFQESTVHHKLLPQSFSLNNDALESDPSDLFQPGFTGRPDTLIPAGIVGSKSAKASGTSLAGTAGAGAGGDDVEASTNESLAFSEKPSFMLATNEMAATSSAAAIIMGASGNASLLPSSDRSPSSQAAKRRRYLRLGLGVLLGLLLCLSVYLSFQFSMDNVKVDFGIPQLMPVHSNLGEALTIVKNFKSSLFSLSIPTGAVSVGTHSPTRAPTAFVPTALPSLSPTARATTATPTSAPTLAPTSLTASPSLTPTPVPSSTPTTLPTAGPPTTPTTSTTAYTVNTCWGISSSKSHIDSDVMATWDEEIFGAYLETGFLTDVQELCHYVNESRASLDIDPGWRRDRDCLFGQLMQTLNSNTYQTLSPELQTVSNLVLLWGTTFPTAVNLLGVEADSAASMGYAPVWVCANFSALTDVSSFLSSPDTAKHLISRWDDALSDHGTVEADSSGVPVTLGSDSFSLAILASEVLSSIVLAGLISIVGFVGLILLFSQNLSLTLAGSLVMIAIMSLTICIHINFVSPVIDLLDIVVLVAVVGMIVDFPIHMLKHFQNDEDTEEADDDDRNNGLGGRGGDGSNFENVSAHSSNNNDNNNSSLAGVGGLGGRIAGSGTTMSSKLFKSSKVGASDLETDPARAGNGAIVTFQARYIATSLVGPVLMTIAVAIPLIFTSFALFRKTGEYIIILSIVSFIVTTLIFPVVLSVCTKTTLPETCARFELCSCLPFLRSARYSDARSLDTNPSRSVSFNG